MATTVICDTVFFLWISLECPEVPKDEEALGIKVHFVLRLKELELGASLVAQWLRIHLPMQGTRVRALVWEDPTCRGATKPVSHNY